MPEYKDLGLAADKITNIQRTSGTGEPGSLDTYTITTASGGSFQFQVRNGTDGNMVIKQEIFGGSGQTLTDLENWIDEDSARAKRIVSMVYIDTSVNPCDIREVSYSLNLNTDMYKFFKASVSGDSQEYIEIGELNATSYIYVYYYDSVDVSLDTSLDINSENAVTNRVITGSLAKPAGVYDTLAELTAAYPSGNSNVYVVRATGKWYTWNGSAWVAQGDYKGIIDVVNDIIVDDTITGNKISPEKLFTREVDLSENVVYVDNKFVSHAGTISNYQGLSYGTIDVNGYTYIEYSSFAVNKYINQNKNNIACFRDELGTVISADTYWDDIELIDETNKILRIKVPNNAKTFYFNIFTADKSSAVVNGLIYNSTKKLNWLKVGGEQIEDNSITPQKLFDSDIEGEEITGQYEVGYYYNQTSNGISYISNNNIASWHYPVEESKKYKIYFGTEINTSTLGAYFIFTNALLPTQSVGSSYIVIPLNEISNYIEYIGNGYYWITIPRGAIYLYTASGASSLINKLYGIKQFSFNWLSLKKDNFKDNTIPQSAIIKDELVSYKYWDSLNKPFDFDNKTLVAFGDSITAGIYNEGSGNQSTTTLSYIALFATKFGMTLNNQAVSGSRFTAGGQYGSIATRITDFTFANTNNEVVIIAGGTNDFNSGAALGQLGDTTDATFYGALDVICQYLTTNAPNSTIIFITPINVNRNESAFPNATNALNDYRNAIWEVATKYKFNVVDGSTIGFAKEVNTPWGNLMIAIEDGTHPTLAGHALYFRGLCGKLK